MTRFGEAAQRYITEARLAIELGGEATPLIDERFISLGERALAHSKNPFFSLLNRAQLDTERPESVDHNRTLLQPNALSTDDVDASLMLVDMMLGEQTTELVTQFGKFADEHQIFERVHSGEKFVVVSNHLELPDQGFTMGLWQKAARERGYDRLENHLTVVVGRLIGYYQLGDTNVVDGILRRAGSVLKTFPAGGTEALSEDEQVLGLFRRICNHQTKEAFHELMTSPEGRIVCMAPSGEQDRRDREEGVVHMRQFGKGTVDMIIDASESGASVIPIFVDYGTNDSIVRLLTPLEGGALASREDCNQLGEVIAAAGSHARGEARLRHPTTERFSEIIVYDND